MTIARPTESEARKIADYALIGDCETAALVHRSGAIEWLCWPRFDSEACLAALLGHEDNGFWRIWPFEDGAKLSRRYRGHTLILETRIDTSEGVAMLCDFMPVRGEASDVIRVIVGREGVVRLRGELDIRFGYGQQRPEWSAQGAHRALATANGQRARLAASVPLKIGDARCSAQFAVRPGDQAAFVLTYFGAGEREPADVDPDQALRETEQFWQDWSGRCTYHGRWREEVIRSLIILKAMTHRPTGGIVAAPTSSLPERPGGQRNWDYRYCWIRDATFLLLALLHTGYKAEAVAWRDWLIGATGNDPKYLHPIYGLGGEADLPEWQAPWLAGFGGARPVRFGNAAAAQQQFDSYGELIDALYHAHCNGVERSPQAWQLQVGLIEQLENIWQKPDRGIWEDRRGPKRFTHSQAMIWVALDRMLREAEREKFDIPFDRWRALQRRIHSEIYTRGIDRRRNCFVREFDGHDVDASLLLLPQIGFIPADDPRMRSTIAAIEADLSDHGFIRRYDTDKVEDGLPGGEAAFLASTFWYADTLALAGRQAAAEAVFERALSACNDVGLLAEEYDPAAAQLRGNFPQALSHIGLVNTALNLSDGGGPAQQRGGSRNLG